jgi:hypothetical protein
MRLISARSKDVGIYGDPNTDAEIDDETTTCSITSTDIEDNLQVEKIITSVPAIRSTRQKLLRYFLGMLYIVAMAGFIFLGVGINMCGTGNISRTAPLCTLINGLNPQAASILGVLLIVIAALLFCLPFAVLIRGCYRKNPTQTIRGISIVLGMWVAAIVGSFVGIYPYIAQLGIGQPYALLLGVSVSLLACFILACRRKTLLIQNMLQRFDATQLAVTIIVMNPLPFGVIVFFSEKQQETVRTASLALFIWTVFWQFLFFTTATMTWWNLLTLIDVDDSSANLAMFLFLATFFLWPFLLHRLYKKSGSFVDWLVVTHGQQHQIMVRMLVPTFEIIDDTEDVISSSQNEIV